jgi:hypothetical protein
VTTAPSQPRDTEVAFHEREAIRTKVDIVGSGLFKNLVRHGPVSAVRRARNLRASIHTCGKGC